VKRIIRELLKIDDVFPVKLGQDAERDIPDITFYSYLLYV